MTTAKEWLLSRTVLPTTGIYTLRDHFTAIVSSVTASIGGEVIIIPATYEVVIEPKSTTIEIQTKTIPINIDTTPTEMVLVDVQKLDIVIDLCG